MQWFDVHKNRYTYNIINIFYKPYIINLYKNFTLIETKKYFNI